MATVAHVDARFTADTGGFVRSVRNAQASTAELSQSMSSMQGAAKTTQSRVEDAGKAAEQAGGGFTILKGAIATAFGVGAVDAIKGAFGAVKNFARSSLDAAGRVEELDIAMKAIGESTGVGADAVREASDAIRANGIELGASQQIAIEFAQNQLDLAQAADVARVAQDLAVIGAKNSTATTKILTRAVITGNSMLLKSAGISRNASEAYQEYADSLGKGLRQLTSVERRQAIINMIMAEGEKVAGTYEASMNAAGKVLRSYARIINDMKVEIGAVLTEAFGPLIKSTYNLIKAFSLALREGGSLRGALASVTDVMVQMTQPIIDVVDQLTEMVKSGELLEKFNDIVSQGAPLFLVFADTVQAFTRVLFSAAVPAVHALLDGLGVLLRAMQPLFDAFRALPDIVKLAVGALIFFQTALGVRVLKALAAANIAVVRFGSTVKAQMAQVRSATMVASGSVVVSLTNKRVAMELAAISARKLAAVAVSSFRAIATAAKGLMASLGPVGIALIGASVALEVFMGRSASAENIVSKLRDTTDEATEAINGLNVAAAAEQLRMDLSNEDIALLESYGITIGDMAYAAVAGGDAAADMQARLEDLAHVGFGDVAKAAIFMGDANKQVFGIVKSNWEGLEGLSAQARQENEDYAKSQEDAARAAERHAWSTGEAQEALTEYRDAGHRAAIATGQVSVESSRAAENVEEMNDEVQEATELFKGLLGTLSSIEATDRAAASLREIGEAATEMGADLMGEGENAEKFRAKVADAMRASVTAVETLGLAAPEQTRVMVGELGKIVNALREQGVSDADIQAYLGAFNDLPVSVEQIMGTAATLLGESADGLTTEVAGSLEAAWKAGEIVSLSAAEHMAESAADEARSALGLMLGPEVESAIEEARLATDPAARRSGEQTGDAIAIGTAQGIRQGSVYVDAAIREMARNGVQAAKDLLGIRSPSRVFLEIGRDLTKGLELGVVKGAPGFSQAMARVLQDAVWAAADARDAVAAAEKSLAEARKEGSTREVAAAERGLARARRDSVDAARAARQAEKDLEATRKLSRRPMGAAPFEKTAEMLGLGDLDGAWDSLEQTLMNRARRFGLSADAAAAYVQATIGKAFEATEKLQRRYQRRVERREALLEQIEQVEREMADRAATRESARADISRVFESLFGEESDFDKAYNAASINIDKAADLFRDLSELIEERFTGAVDAGERDRLTAFLREQTEDLVALIDRRDRIMARLSAEERTLGDMMKERDQAEGRLRDSIESFFKPSGNITSADEYIVGLQQRVDATRRYMSDIDELRQRGVGESTIEQILTMGPEAGGSLAAALSGATDEQLEYVNALTAQSETMAGNFSRTQADIMYGAGITAQQELVRGLRDEYDTVIGEIETITAAIEAELAPLGEESYNVGVLMGEELLAGLQAEEARVTAEIQSIGERINKAWAKALGVRLPSSAVQANSRVGVVSAPMPSVASSLGSMRMSEGAVQVQVNVGEGQNQKAVRRAVTAAVRDALEQVNSRAKNARR